MRWYAITNLVAVIVLFGGGIGFLAAHKQKGWIPIGIALADIVVMSILIVLAKRKGQG
jgi:hypothetical protein